MVSQILRDLEGEAEKLKHDHPADACQIYLICAAYMSNAGHKADALATLRQSVDLAKEQDLPQESLWALLGSCAICLQAGDYEQAANHFEELQSALYEQNEWMLADYIDVFRQFLLGSGTLETKNDLYLAERKELEPLLSSTFDWLSRWGGFVRPSVNATYGAQPCTGDSTQEDLIQSLPSPPSLQGPWHTLKLMFSGELRLHWKKDSLPANHPSSIWGSVLNSPWLRFLGQTRDAPTIDVVPQASDPLQEPEETGSEQEFIVISPPKQDEDPTNTLTDMDRLPEPETIVIPVFAHMLGKFELSIRETPFKLPATRSLSLLKYLLLHHKQDIPREVLMDVFWPEATPETARNNLNVAMHNLRKALRSALFLPLIVYENGIYRLDPSLQVWLDVEEFERCVEAGKRSETRGHLTAAVKQYESAISLYEGDFLEQNPYEEWTIHDRERLRVAYLDTLERMSQIYFHQESYAACITVCQRMLTYDPCREDAYCLLMRCYSRQGQDHLALRQYQNCIKALRAEMEVDPAPETTGLYNRIRRREKI